MDIYDIYKIIYNVERIPFNSGTRGGSVILASDAANDTVPVVTRILQRPAWVPGQRGRSNAWKVSLPRSKRNLLTPRRCLWCFCRKPPGMGLGEWLRAKKKETWGSLFPFNRIPNPQTTKRTRIPSPPPTACDSSNYFRKLLLDNFPLEICHWVLAAKDVR